MSSVQEITEREIPSTPALSAEGITEPFRVWVDESELSQLCLRWDKRSVLTLEENFQETTDAIFDEGVISFDAFEMVSAPGTSGNNSVFFAMFPNDWPVRLDQAASPANVINTLIWVQDAKSGKERNTTFPHTQILEA